MTESPEVAVELESQPHGGALKRSHALPPDRPYTDTRQEQRLDALPQVYRQALERLCVELSLHMEAPEEVFAAHHYTPEQAAELIDSPAFIAMLERIGKEVRENGLSFRQKARAIAEECLPLAFEMASDAQTSAAVRADLIKWFSKVGDLDPKPKDDGGKTGGGLTLSITFSGQAPVQVVSAEREPLTITQEQE